MIKKILGGGLSWLYVALVLLPILWVLVTSVKSSQEILDSPLTLPATISLENYARAWTAQKLDQAFLTSLLATLFTLLILMPTGCMAAYALAKYKFKYSGLLLGLFTAGLMFPNLLAAVPLFIMSAKAGLDDTLVGLVLVYTAYSLAFTVFVMHGFFEVLPDELAEAATIDGCGHWQNFLKVMLPLAKPGLVVVGIFNAIGLWNEYNLAKVLLVSHKTLPVTLSDLVSQQQYAGDWGALYAGAVIVMLPVLIVYWMLRDKIQQAMLAGAIK